MKIVKIKDEIFRANDVRGIYGEELNEDVAYTFGKSFGTYIQLMGEKDVLIGNDNRESGPELVGGLIKGITDSGANVIYLGLVTTPMYYFAKKKQNMTAGIMVTASHNPREYNGFKFSFSKKGNACGDDIIAFRDFTNKGEYKDGTGEVSNLDIREDYLKQVKNSVDLGPRRVKVVYDCGNGTGSIIVKDILDMFDVDYELLYCDSDPTFPHHHPDPCVHENMIDLGKKVKELGYDLGIGIDGDADRVGLVDENGNVISSDLMMLIVYRFLAPSMRNKKAIYDIKCSKTLIDGIEALGLKGTMNRCGNSYMNMAVNEGDYDFGGEYSGHVWFRDKWLGFDDGIYAGLRLIEILSKSEGTISDMLANTNKYYSTEEIKFKAPDEIKFAIVDKVHDYCTDKHYEIIDIDGVRVTFDDGWALVRASNTGPNLTVRFEAKTEERLASLQNEFTNLVNELLKDYQ